ncbi:MAG: HD domain-containing protein [Fibrobacteres bacterium]|nr:HD domain-containing protein [Fibrobacterota bacterium]
MSSLLKLRISIFCGLAALALVAGGAAVVGASDYYTLLNIIFGALLIGLLISGATYFILMQQMSAKKEFSEKSVLDASLAGIFIVKQGLGMGDVSYINPSYAELFKEGQQKLVADEFISERFWVDPSQRPSVMETVTREKIITSIEIHLKNNQGREWWAQLSSRHLDTPEGIKIQGTLIDITEKKKFEEVLTNYNETLEKEIGERTRERDEIQKVSILGLSKITEYRDPETGNHVIRMAHYSKMIARALRDNPKYRHYITDTYVDEIFISAPLHDIGKVGIEDAVLKKPGKLTPEEFEMMKYHTVYGGDTLRDVERQLTFRSFLTLGKEIAYNHHQKWDGTGYPNYPPEGGHCTLNIPGHKPLKGTEIPLSSRIVALADVYDALTSKRCYKSAVPPEKAKAIILEEKGRHFDPDIVDAFLACESECLTILGKYKD